MHLGVREGTEVVYAAKMGGHRQARSPSRLAAAVPEPGQGVRAAVSVTGPVHLFRPERHADALGAAAAGITAMLARRAALGEDP